MSKGHISIYNLSTYRVCIYDDGNIRLLYSTPQEILIENNLIRIGNLQIIDKNDIASIVRYNNIINIKLINGGLVELYVII